MARITADQRTANNRLRGRRASHDLWGVGVDGKVCGGLSRETLWI
jgi:hypothetical protein